MLALTALFERRALKKILSILQRGECLRFSFHPNRQGQIRLACGREVLHITWRERCKLRSLDLNGRSISLSSARERKLLDGLLARADLEALRGQALIETKLPIRNAGKIKRSCSITAQRLALAIETATEIRSTLNEMGFGEMVTQIGTLRIRLSILEEGKAPAITVNGRSMFAHKADIRHITKAITRKQRKLSRAATISQAVLEAS